MNYQRISALYGWLSFECIPRRGRGQRFFYPVKYPDLKKIRAEKTRITRLFTSLFWSRLRLDTVRSIEFSSGRRATPVFARNIHDGDRPIWRTHSAWGRKAAPPNGTIFRGRQGDGDGLSLLQTGVSDSLRIVKHRGFGPSSLQGMICAAVIANLFLSSSPNALIAQPEGPKNSLPAARFCPICAVISAKKGGNLQQDGHFLMAVTAPRGAGGFGTVPQEIDDAGQDAADPGRQVSESASRRSDSRLAPCFLVPLFPRFLGPCLYAQ